MSTHRCSRFLLQASVVLCDVVRISTYIGFFSTFLGCEVILFWLNLVVCSLIASRRWYVWRTSKRYEKMRECCFLFFSSRSLFCACKPLSFLLCLQGSSHWSGFVAVLWIPKCVSQCYRLSSLRRGTFMPKRKLPMTTNSTAMKLVIRSLAFVVLQNAEEHWISGLGPNSGNGLDSFPHRNWGRIACIENLGSN